MRKIMSSPTHCESVSSFCNQQAMVKVAWIEAGAPFRLNPRPRIVAIAPMIKKRHGSFFHTNPDDKDLLQWVDTKRYKWQKLRVSKYERPPPYFPKSSMGWLRRKMISVFLFVFYDLKKKRDWSSRWYARRIKRTGNDNFKVLIAGGQPYRSTL